ASSTDGPLELRDSGGTLLLTLVAGRTYSAVDSSWVTRSPGSLNQAVPSAQQPSGTTVALRLNGAVKTGTSSSANNTLLQDNVKITITYTVPTITAVLSATESPDTLSAAVSNPVSGTLSATESSDTLAASLSDPVAAVLAANEADDTMTASVSVTSGSITATLAV